MLFQAKNVAVGWPTLIKKAVNLHQNILLMPKLKILLIIILSLLLLAAAVLLLCDYLVTSNARGRLYEDTSSIPHRTYGLLLGTSPKSRITGRANIFYIYRINATAELYKSGKVDTILVSGSDNSHEGANEPECMRESLIKCGVPASVIKTDGKGYRTLESVVRARDEFGITSYTVISQQFHNERTLYLSDHCKLHDTIAFNAVSPHTGWSFITYIREYFARVKMFCDVLSA